MSQRSPVVEIHRAPGATGVLVEASEHAPRVFRWPGGPANDVRGAPPSEYAEGGAGWAGVDAHYARILLAAQLSTNV